MSQRNVFLQSILKVWDVSVAIQRASWSSGSLGKQAVEEAGSLVHFPVWGWF